MAVWSESTIRRAMPVTLVYYQETNHNFSFILLHGDYWISLGAGHYLDLWSWLTSDFALKINDIFYGYFDPDFF